MTIINEGIDEQELWRIIENGGEVYGIVESRVCYAIDSYGDLVFAW